MRASLPAASVASREGVAGSQGGPRRLVRAQALWGKNSVPGRAWKHWLYRVSLEGSLVLNQSLVSFLGHLDYCSQGMREVCRLSLCGTLSCVTEAVVHECAPLEYTSDSAAFLGIEHSLACSVPPPRAQASESGQGYSV